MLDEVRSRLADPAETELFLFSSDHPHPEGSRDPIGKFEASLGAAQIDEARRTRFYAESCASKAFPSASPERVVTLPGSIHEGGTPWPASSAVSS